MENTGTFGYWVRRRRKALDLTQTELARRVACSLAMVKKIELDERRPSRLMATRLAESLDIPAAELESFMAAARGERSPEELALPSSPVAAQPGAAQSLTASRNNLPLQLTRLVGRTAQVAEVCELLRLQQTRVITLTGPGGVGKTRLALQVATEVLPTFPEGAWLVELASLTDPSLVEQKVAATLGLVPASTQPLVETLIAALRNQRMLLLLDNCEHLVEACSQLAHTLITACSGVAILATSREPLHCAGETIWPVPPLDLPDLQRLPAPEALSGIGSISLFLDRARAALPSFVLTPQNALPVARLCSRLDGLPLAIELAAAQVRVFNVEAIAAQLDDNFHALAPGTRTAPPRHQTLRAALDWSYDLLSAPEQALFRRLGVFAGSFTLEAVLQVCSFLQQAGKVQLETERLPGSASLVDLFARLVDKSLVEVARGKGGQQRYRLLEPVRQYAIAKINAPAEIDHLRERHFAYYARLAEQIEPELFTEKSLVRLDQLEIELDNFRLALDWSLRGKEDPAAAEAGLRLAAHLERFWADRCYFAEGRSWIERGLAKIDQDEPRLAPVLARAYGADGVLASEQFDALAARHSLEKSIVYARQCGDALSLALALVPLARLLFFSPEHKAALPLIDESIEICSAVGNKWGLAMAYSVKGGLLSWHATDLEQARRYTEESIRLFRETGDRLEASANYSQLGWFDFLAGELTQARLDLDVALAAYRENKDRAAIAYASELLAKVTYLQRDFPAMAACAQESVRLRQEVGHASWHIDDLLWLAVARYELGDIPGAAAVLTEQLDLLVETRNEFDIPLNLIGWSSIAAAWGEVAQAARLKGAAEALLKQFDFHYDPATRALVDRSLEDIRLSFDGASFSAACVEGSAMTLSQAVQAARGFATRAISQGKPLPVGGAES